MNNKGQTLVLFIMLLPILFILISFITDIGFLYIEKNKIQNVVKITIEDELKREAGTSNQRVATILNKNIDDVVIEKLEINTNSIVISISKRHKSIFSKILKNNIYEIRVIYKGIKQNDKVIIKGSD